MNNHIISRELEVIDAVMDGALSVLAEARAKKADVKQARVATDAMGRANAAVRNRLEVRLNQPRLIEIEASLVDASEQVAIEHSPVK